MQHVDIWKCFIYLAIKALSFIVSTYTSDETSNALLSNITTQKQTEQCRQFICTLLINYHFKNTHKPSLLLLCLTTGFQICIFFLKSMYMFFSTFSLSTSHSKQRLELATLPTDLCVKRVYSNMLTSTKSTGGRGAAGMSQEDEDEGFKFQLNGRLLGHHADMNLHYPLMANQWDHSEIWQEDCERRAPNNVRKRAELSDSKSSLIRFLLANTGQQGRHTWVCEEGLFFIKWYFQEFQYNSTGSITDAHSTVSAAGVKLAAKHIQLHYCSNGPTVPTDSSGFGLEGDE